MRLEPRRRRARGLMLNGRSETRAGIRSAQGILNNPLAQ
jgi:hypothetical protein